MYCYFGIMYSGHVLIISESVENNFKWYPHLPKGTTGEGHGGNWL